MYRHDSCPCSGILDTVRLNLNLFRVVLTDVTFGLWLVFLRIQKLRRGHGVIEFVVNLRVFKALVQLQLRLWVLLVGELNVGQVVEEDCASSLVTLNVRLLLRALQLARVAAWARRDKVSDVVNVACH